MVVPPEPSPSLSEETRASFQDLLATIFERSSIARINRIKGVTLHKRTQRYEAHHWSERKQLYLGAFETEQMAAKCYDVMVLYTKGRAAGSTLNFPVELYEQLFPLFPGLSKEDVITVMRNHSKVGRAMRKRSRSLQYNQDPHTPSACIYDRGASTSPPNKRHAVPGIILPGRTVFVPVDSPGRPLNNFKTFFTLGQHDQEYYKDCIGENFGPAMMMVMNGTHTSCHLGGGDDLDALLDDLINVPTVLLHEFDMNSTLQPQSSSLAPGFDDFLL